MEDHAHGTTGTEEEPEHLRELRRRLEGLEGEEIRAKIERYGADATLREIETERLKREMGGWNAGEGGREESPDDWRRRMLGDAAQASSSSSSSAAAASS